MNEELLKQAEIALGSSFRLMEQYYFLKKRGWHCYWNLDTAIAHAAKNVKSLIWC